MLSKNIVIIGGTGGIGYEVCKFLINEGYNLFVAYRNREKLEALLNLSKEINPIYLNLESFKSIDNFCLNVIEQTKGNIDIIINNGGVIAPKFKLTEDLYETSLQVNYIAPKRIIEHLLPYLNRDGKIINTISCTIYTGKGVCPLKVRDENEYKRQQRAFNHLKNYSNSKYLLAKYTKELYYKLKDNYIKEKNISIICIDPGVVNTSIITMHRWYDSLANILFRPFIKSPKSGAIPIINAITSQPLNNIYLFKGKRKKIFDYNFFV